MRGAGKPGIFRKLIKWIVLLIVLGMICILGINFYMIRSAQKYILPQESLSGASYDCALVLGARVYKSGNLSPMLEDRVLAGVEAYQNGAASKLLMSGDREEAKNYDEVGPMKDFAILRGVPEKDIDIDPEGYSTYDSMYRAKNVLSIDRAVIVTQKFHLCRAIYIARAMGIDARGVVADRRDYRNQWYNCLRETLARVKDFFTVLAGVNPSLPHSG